MVDVHDIRFCKVCGKSENEHDDEQTNECYLRLHGAIID